MVGEAPGLPWLVADIGGTNARFGWVSDVVRGVEHVDKLPVARVAGPDEAAKTCSANMPPEDIRTYVERTIKEADRLVGEVRDVLTYIDAPLALNIGQPMRLAEFYEIVPSVCESLFMEDCVCTMQVTGHNRGGLLVSGQGLQGFVPVSHLLELTGDRSGIIPDDWADAYHNCSLRLKIIECDQERGRVVLFERAARALPGSRKRLLEHLQPGDCLYGTVTNITEFGIFVDPCSTRAVGTARSAAPSRHARKQNSTSSNP